MKGTSATTGLPGSAPFSRSPGLAVLRTVFRGAPRYIVSDVAAGRRLAVSPQAYALLARLDGKRSLVAIQADIGVGPAEGDSLMRWLLAAGLVTAPGLEMPAIPPAGPIEGKALFMRRELVELGPWLPAVDRAMGWLFRPAAVAL